MNPFWIILSNLVAPGAGLIALQRARLGFCTAMLFCVLAQVSVVGFLISPATIPTWISTLAGLSAVFVWGWAQWVARQRLRARKSGLGEPEI